MFIYVKINFPYVFYVRNLRHVEGMPCMYRYVLNWFYEHACFTAMLWIFGSFCCFGMKFIIHYRKQAYFVGADFHRLKVKDFTIVYVHSNVSFSELNDSMNLPCNG